MASSGPQRAMAPIGLLVATGMIVLLAFQYFDGWVTRGAVILGGGLLGWACQVAVMQSIERARITVRGGQLIKVDHFGTRVVTVAQPIARIVATECQVSRLRADANLNVWLFVDAAGRSAMRIHPEQWDADDLAQLRATLDVPLEVRTGPVTAARLRDEFPGALPWWLAHLALTTTAGIFGLSVALLLAQGA